MYSNIILVILYNYYIIIIIIYIIILINSMFKWKVINKYYLNMLFILS